MINIYIQRPTLSIVPFPASVMHARESPYLPVHRCLCVHLLVCAPRCLATFGLTKPTNTSDSDIAGDKWDVYSLALVLWFLFSEKHPFADERDAEIVRGVVEHGRRPQTVGMGSGLAALVSRMWSAGPEDRPSAAEVARAFADGLV